MTITWTGDQSYIGSNGNNTTYGTNDIGTIAYGNNNSTAGSSILPVKNAFNSSRLNVNNLSTSNISSIIIPKGTTITGINSNYNSSSPGKISKDSNGYSTDTTGSVIVATVNLNNALASTGKHFKQVKVYLVYNGYVNYTSHNSNTNVATPNMDAINFSYAGIVPNSSVDIDGNNSDYWRSNSYGDSLKLSNVIGNIFLLPTYENVGTLVTGSNIAKVADLSIICFLSGTEIKTPLGFKNIENLHEGDLVIALQSGKEVSKKIISIQKGEVIATIKDEKPVCFKKNSIEDNVPYKDLYVTSEHCLYLNNKFIPARMLVNGSSIIVDEEQKRYTFYHIECEDHSIIIANGAASESYLNTNHIINRNKNVITIGYKTWEKDAAAPLAVTREIVEPIFKNLKKRAKEIGFVENKNDLLLTNDPDLKLITSQGEEIFPSRKNNDKYIFHVPSNNNSIRIISRSSQQSNVIGPFVDDRRHLGVLVGEITVFQSNRTTNIKQHLNDSSLFGWNNIENENYCRWTTGNSIIYLNNIKDINNYYIISIQVISENYYELTEDISMLKKA